jgi:hypothetical protein
MALVFNVALGKVAYYTSLPLTNDALVIVPLAASGLVSDAVMRDYADLQTLLAGTTDEQSTMGRKTLTGVTGTVDNTNDRFAGDAGDVTWTAATGAAVAAFVICYDPDTTTGTDADLIPLTKHELSLTPDGTNFVLSINDFVRDSSTG